MLFLCINLEDMSLVGLPSNYLIPLTYNVPITRHRTLRFCRIKKQRKRVMVRGEGFGLRFPANSPRTRTTYQRSWILRGHEGDKLHKRQVEKFSMVEGVNLQF
ncbi:PREDICTED: uncharacterized protein LOC104730355 isoform X4 [Camelina sativa]|uniref:Uncharacterized protein LOC104730355 isoform X4 n=1 Tax=Camelina sativa TaxID=90675 RepID=A0ABM0UXL4_CAMSA|nr:PREDICTED: uncharacterized protein LOC104730355 isoform X4 [Camelina sativa]